MVVKSCQGPSLEGKPHTPVGFYYQELCFNYKGLGSKEKKIPGGFQQMGQWQWSETSMLLIRPALRSRPITRPSHMGGENCSLSSSTWEERKIQRLSPQWEGPGESGRQILKFNHSVVHNPEAQANEMTETLRVSQNLQLAPFLAFTFLKTYCCIYFN